MHSPKIYFVRHGQSIANSHGLAAGSLDSPLTDEGIKQAHSEAIVILRQQIDFNKIIASPLSRAFDTARIIAQQIGFNEGDIITSDLLKERRLGDFEGKDHSVFWAVTESEREAMHCEKLESLYERVEDANKFILSQSKGSQNVLVVGHSGFYRMARCVAEGLEPKMTYSLDQPKNSTLLDYPL